MDVLILDCGDDIAGESTMDGYAKKIELLSFSHGVAQQITGDQSNQKRTSGKPNHQDFTVTKYVDLASCGLIDFCNQAKNLATVKIVVGQNEAGKVNAILTYTMTNALISSVSVGGGGGGKPQETVTFNYTKIKWDYKQQASAVSDSGTNSAKWSLETNKAE
ncbi:MAG TPA: type VI secretion system tube protein Hcp [Candidatus Solibacter sp.]|jgi:type VI secretion system secreted protein Hcp|nr:type VI secretion system tube protein Hcp [Candidatus Solibacter sp.]